MAGHEHSNHCYWDFREARWVCRADVAEDERVTRFEATTVIADEPVAAVVEPA